MTTPWNTSQKSIVGWERLDKFLREHPEYYIVDTGDRERRYYVRSDKDNYGLSVDGRSVKVLTATGRAKVRRV